eukprot:9070549-Lingulodinium_polyedra.AAC.1
MLQQQRQRAVRAARTNIAAMEVSTRAGPPPKRGWNTSDVLYANMLFRTHGDGHCTRVAPCIVQ